MALLNYNEISENQLCDSSLSQTEINLGPTYLKIEGYTTKDQNWNELR